MGARGVRRSKKCVRVLGLPALLESRRGRSRRRFLVVEERPEPVAALVAKVNHSRPREGLRRRPSLGRAWHNEKRPSIRPVKVIATAYGERTVVGEALRLKRGLPAVEPSVPRK